MPTTAAHGNKTKRPANRAAEAAKKELRSTLRAEFQDWLKRAPIADFYFLKEVFVCWRSYHSGDDELAIISAFATAIDNHEGEYLRIENGHMEAVLRFIEQMKSGEIIPGEDSQAPASTEAAAEPAVAGFSLPRNMRLSDDERAYVARLVRLLRDNYWGAELVRQILDKESRARHQLTAKYVRDLLASFDTLESLALNARKLRSTWRNHPIVRAVRDEWAEINDYKDERSIRELIDSASK